MEKGILAVSHLFRMCLRRKYPKVNKLVSWSSKVFKINQNIKVTVRAS